MPSCDLKGGLPVVSGHLPMYHMETTSIYAQACIFKVPSTTMYGRNVMTSLDLTQTSRSLALIARFLEGKIQKLYIQGVQFCKQTYLTAL